MNDHDSDVLIETTLGTYLANELRRAEADFPHIPLGQPARRRSGPGLALAIIATISIVTVGVVWLRLPAAQPGSAATTASASSQPTASAQTVDPQPASPKANAQDEPSAVANRPVLAACGTEAWTSQSGPLNGAGRTCFINAYRAQQPAEFITTRPTTEGDPITMIFRVLNDGRVEVFFDSSLDRFAGPDRGWQQFECASLTTMDGGAATVDDFGPNDACVVTTLH